MPLQETSGTASYDAFGGGAAVVPNYIEDVFSTWLYTGNGSTQTITNGIDLAGKGGLVWIKSRDNTSATTGHALFDTVRGRAYGLASQTTAAQIGPSASSSDLSSFNSNGFTVEGNNNWALNIGVTYASWTFRKQPKFFDVVTYTGNGSSTQAVNHNLGSVPGCIFIKATVTDTGQSNGNWIVFHRSIPDNFLMLNRTDAQNAQSGATTGTSTTFNAINGICNGNGVTYVAYLFAHNAGGFGLTGTDNVISCGSFTTDSSGNFTTTLGYEPQWILFKNSGAVSNWNLIDNMRGWPVGAGSSYLRPNTSGAETTDSLPYMIPTATGFAGINGGFGNTQTYIYIAIRRGPMKTPTTGTSVFNAIARTGTGATATVSGVGFSPDMVLAMRRDNHPGQYNVVADRLRGPVNWLGVNSTEPEYNNSNMFSSFTMDGFVVGSEGSVNNYLSGIINWNFRRAPGFFDVVCFTGSPSSVNHNLGVVPELIIAKSRQDGIGPDNWAVATQNVNYLSLNLSDASLFGGVSLSATATTFNPTTVRTADNYFAGFGGVTAVAYLFASCPGVSKVGSYTGTGALQTINCGFTGGARWVMIKRTDSTGDWWVYDSARGISSGNDPYLFLNSTAAEVTGTNYVDTTSVGFQVTAAAPAGLNANGGTYIFLAIA